MSIRERLLAVLALALLLTPGLMEAAHHGFGFAKCVGADPCKACSSCRYCKWCAKDGGTCGVCKR